MMTTAKVFLLCSLLSNVVLAQNSTGTSSPNPESIVSFQAVTGWSLASTIRSVKAEGTVTVESMPEPFDLKIDRSGRVRTHLKSSNLTMVAGPLGGYTVGDKGGRKLLSIEEATRNGASVLMPIFTPLGEVGSDAVNLSAVGDGDSSTQKLAVSKKWALGDGFDEVRQKAQKVEANFDPSTHLLTSLTMQCPNRDTPATPNSVLIEYSDWRPAGPVLLPYTVKESSNGQVDFVVHFTSINVNAPVSDEDFQ